MLLREARSRSDSQFVELSEGYTEYEIAGPASGEPVILIHGLSVPMFDFDGQFASLADTGFRVLRYNQYGRGFSDRPRGPYNTERYTTQIHDLMESQGWSRAHLVGHSMGCAIAAEFALRYPDKVDRMVLVSPVLHIAQGNTGISLARIPVIGDVASKLVLSSVLAGRADDLFPATGAAQDESVPQEHFAVISQLVPRMATVQMEGAGHMPTIERPEETTLLIAGFLGK